MLFGGCRILLNRFKIIGCRSYSTNVLGLGVCKYVHVLILSSCFFLLVPVALLMFLNYFIVQIAIVGNKSDLVDKRVSSNLII